MDTPPTSAPSTDRLPAWLSEALDVLSARRRVVVATAVGLVLLGAIVALVAPSILPGRAVVGAAVGIAAALLATALALAMDASDLVVRGVRHVRAAGGTVDVHVGRQHDDIGPLLAAVARHASDGRVRVALSSASRSAGVPGVRAGALAEALARTGRKVLMTDLARGGTPAAGLSDVITGSRSLPEVVRFEQELYLARLAVGSDPDAAIRGFAGWVDGLPSDLEVLVAALPPLAEPGVLAAAGAMDVTLVLVEVDRTERVDLIASLDAVDAAGLTSELVLVDPAHVAPVAPESQDEEPAGEEHEEHHDAPATAEADEHADADAEVEEPDTGAVADDVLGDSEPADVLAEIGLDPAPEDHVSADEEPVAETTESTEEAGPADEPSEADEAGRGSTGEVAALLGGPPPLAGATVPPSAVAGVDEPAEASDEPAEASDEPDVDATAEILLPTGPDDELSHIWDPAPSDEPEPADAESPDELEPAPVETVPVASAPEPEPVEPEPAAAPEDPEPTEDVSPRPVPAAVANGSTPSELSADPAALEVARASAALHQLAQQIWDRDDR